MNVNIHVETIRKQSKGEIEHSCQYWDMKFQRRHDTKRHEKKKHMVSLGMGYMLINNYLQSISCPKEVCK